MIQQRTLLNGFISSRPRFKGRHYDGRAWPGRKASKSTKNHFSSKQGLKEQGGFGYNNRSLTAAKLTKTRTQPEFQSWPWPLESPASQTEGLTLWSAQARLRFARRCRAMPPHRTRSKAATCRRTPNVQTPDAELESPAVSRVPNQTSVPSQDDAEGSSSFGEALSSGPEEPLPVQDRAIGLACWRRNTTIRA